MPLSREDYVDILRHLQREVRERDREAHAIVAEYTEPSNDPRQYLLAYLRLLVKVLSERSSGAHGQVLNLLNRNIRTQEGAPLRGITLELSPAEREVYQQERIDLALLPDRGVLVEALLSLYQQLSEEGREPGRHQ